LQIDDRCRCRSRGEGRGNGCCRRNDYMRRGTESATRVGDVCWRMNMRDLNRRAKNQQQRAAKSKGEPPRVSRVISGLLIVHHSNYNVPLLRR
jgi:hypothetical protein